VIIAISIQDRDADRPCCGDLYRCRIRARLAWADAGYAIKLATWAASLMVQLKIVRKRDAHTFEVPPRRWVVERILAWITAHRRGARDHHRVPEGHEAMVARITQHLATPRP
jgi:transposase